MDVKEEQTLITAKFSMWATIGFFARKFMLLYLLVLLGVAYFVFFEADIAALQYVFYGLIGLYFIIYIAYVLRTRVRTLELTDKRFIDHIGRAFKRHRFIPLKAVNEITVESTRMGRRLKYGHIVLHLPGRELRFDFVTRPYEIVEEFFSLH